MVSAFAGVAMAADAVPQLSGTWKPARSLDAGVRTSDGKLPPLTAKGRATQGMRLGAAQGLPAPRDREIVTA